LKGLQIGEVIMTKTVNTDGSVTIGLKHKIKGLDNADQTSITLKRPKGAQMRRVNLGMLDDGDHLMRVIGDLAGLPPPIIDQLDAEDIIQGLRPQIFDFFGLSPRTSGN
jgi:hypothetical protein